MAARDQSKRAGQMAVGEMEIARINGAPPRAEELSYDVDTAMEVIL